MTSSSYDAILVVSFGGPESKDDVIPFLENVLRGKNVPRQRMLEVAEHYYRFDGKSPINQQTRELIDALRRELDVAGIKLPIYWGNRNWHPMLPETIRQMAQDGIQRAVAYVTSAYSSYSGCRQYREDILEACIAAGSAAPQVDKLRVFYNHPEFIAAQAEQVRTALEQFPVGRRDGVKIFWTAHSIPMSMAGQCNYESQLRETARLVEQALAHTNSDFVYQSRSGPPHQPWLEPDVCDALKTLHHETPCRDVVIAPIGFLSDHLEVLYDLDVEARQVCQELGINMVRVATVGTQDRFVGMIRELIQERLDPTLPRRSEGSLGPSHDVCPDDCCPRPPRRPPTRP